VAMVETKPKRCWFQFSLRTLLGVVTILAAVSAWLAAIWHGKLEQRRIVAELREGAAEIYYDYEADDWPANSNLIPPGPAWARSILGDDAFTEPAYASITVSAIDVGALDKLERLTTLTTLYLQLLGDCKPFHAVRRMSKLNDLALNGPVDGHDIVDLEPMPRLAVLTLGSRNDGTRSSFDDVVCMQIKRVFPGLTNLTLQAQVSDAAVESLSGMQMLETLDVTSVGPKRLARLVLHDCPRLKAIAADYSASGYLFGCHFDAIDLTNLPALESLPADGDSIHLRNLPNLRKFDGTWVKELQISGVNALEEADFAGSDLPATAFAQLAACHHLTYLNLRAKPEIDDVLEYVARVPSLKKLDLANSAVTDVGLARLKSLPHLEELDLSGCKITDALLDQLRGMKCLRSLNLNLTPVTPAAVARIEAAIPGLKCSVDLNPHPSF
jgi:hypothetical protein